MNADALKASLDELEETLRVLRRLVVAFENTERSEMFSLYRYRRLSREATNLQAKAAALKVLARTVHDRGGALARSVKKARAKVEREEAGPYETPAAYRLKAETKRQEAARTKEGMFRDLALMWVEIYGEMAETGEMPSIKEIRRRDQEILDRYDMYRGPNGF